ncbi:MAG: thioredoxin family protein [Candidatus Omnitrophica bacterium]|nr:thioredoxin family protein [Candidatus Omnitrophota bacterium]
MKRVAMMAGLVFFMGTAVCLAGLKPGDSLPQGVVETAMQSVSGETVSIAQAKGEKGTLVIFSCNHCPWVKAWEKRIAATGNAAQEKGVGVIMINSNDPVAYPEDSLEKMKERTAQIGFEFPYVVDATSGVARAFGASRTPEFFLFNPQGELVYTGALDDNSENPSAVTRRYVEEAIDQMLAGEPVATPETKSVGCGIKFRN